MRVLGYGGLSCVAVCWCTISSGGRVFVVSHALSVSIREAKCGHVEVSRWNVRVSSMHVLRSRLHNMAAHARGIPIQMQLLLRKVRGDGVLNVSTRVSGLLVRYMLSMGRVSSRVLRRLLLLLRGLRLGLLVGRLGMLGRRGGGGGHVGCWGLDGL